MEGRGKWKIGPYLGVTGGLFYGESEPTWIIFFLAGFVLQGNPPESADAYFFLNTDVGGSNHGNSSK